MRLILPNSALHIVVAVVLLCRMPLAGATVRVAFLTDRAALKDTLEILHKIGCSDGAAGAFQRAVERYSLTGFDFDFGKFPKPRDGFYLFESASNLVAALPHQLCNTAHAYEFNCFDTVVALAGESLRMSLRPDDIAGPFLVPHTPTNGSFSIVPKATARDAFELAYPSWYREATKDALPASLRDSRICLTAALFRCYVLPQSTTELRLGAGVLDALRVTWDRQGMKFGSNFYVVLCHEVNFPQRTVVTAHAGLLHSWKGGFTYIEKAGGSGPFVRLDFNDRNELLSWLTGMFKGAERFGYTHHFATFNDASIESLDFAR